ncbi:MAG TPA: rhodanese-like domain-containing protein [Oligoflexus sp.]|uniref:rhodanese-like domain-containing protein n=1 Tax=Oligoflexus sp. TaxID=1971216 RepID=UPI002D8099DB|nr:rhodanese-like domain-containing protein [Oligoflexus sp.]HET9238140.1 rhodanese-like domain-containing protein [Oligoflexus sp.]
MSHYKETTADTVYEEYQKFGSVHLIDVREPGEFAELRTPISRNLPLSEIEASEVCESLQIPKGEPIYLICGSGKRSARACEILARQGYLRLYNVSGGMLAWKQGLLPTV